MEEIFTPGAITITGITASGKTTLALKLYRDLIKIYPKSNIIILDGEELRKSMDRNYGFSPEERYKAFINVLNVVEKYVSDGYLVIIASIFYMKKMREKFRNNIPDTLEVYLDCPVEICAKRDYKGHYEKAFRGEHKMFVGVTHMYEPSFNPELTLKTGEESQQISSKKLLDETLKRFCKLQIHED